MVKPKRIPCRPQDQDQIEKAAKHVDYECEALGKTQREIRSWNDFAPTELESVKRAAIYVAWLVHLRCVLTFFRNAQFHGDEVLACHFMDDPAKWASDHAGELRLSDAENRRVEMIEHLVSHLTYDRLSEVSDFGPHDHQMAIKRLRIFYASLPQRHKPRFPALAALLASLPTPQVKDAGGTQKGEGSV